MRDQKTRKPPPKVPKSTAKAESIVIVVSLDADEEGEEEDVLDVEGERKVQEKPSRPKVAAVAMMEEPAARVETGRMSDKGPRMISPRMRPNGLVSSGVLSGIDRRVLLTDGGEGEEGGTLGC